MASTCKIQFDNNPLGVYYAGQTVTGIAELITSRPKTIRSIYISINGFAEVRWTENVIKQNSQGKRENGIETFSASELYFTTEQYVYGQSGGSQIELPAGKYVYPFQATIPPNAPTSFNGTDGKITYEVLMVIDRVLRYNNTFKKEFTVISPFDLNLNPSHALPMEQEEQKNFCLTMCCRFDDLILAKVQIPFSAYSPGQKINFNIVLDNQSDISCSNIKVKLMRKSTFTSTSPETKSKWNEIKIAQVLLGEVLKRNKAEMNEYIQIPSTVPSSLENCSIIKISYTLRFNIKLAGFYTDFDVVFPLTIGTVPLQASQGSIVIGQPGIPPVCKPLAPPSYEEDASEKKKYQDNPNAFIPRYPVFSSNTSSSGTIRNVADGNLYPISNFSSTPSCPKKPTETNIPSKSAQKPIIIGWNT